MGERIGSPISIRERIGHGEIAFYDAPQAMILTINGEDRQFSSVATISELLDQLGVKPDRVAVELNGELIGRDRWTQTQLADRDKLEIVHFVGGGHAEPAGSRETNERPRRESPLS